MFTRMMNGTIYCGYHLEGTQYIVVTSGICNLIVKERLCHGER